MSRLDVALGLASLLIAFLLGFAAAGGHLP